jgi:hypothetical protein
MLISFGRVVEHCPVTTGRPSNKTKCNTPNAEYPNVFDPFRIRKNGIKSVSALWTVQTESKKRCDKAHEYYKNQIIWWEHEPTVFLSHDK